MTRPLILRIGAACVAVVLATGCSSVADETTTGGVPDEDASSPSFVLSSSAFVDEGTLPTQYTCDGIGVSPPLQWTGAPEGTAEFALLMTTLANDGTKWNWVLYRIPAETTALAEDTAGVGTCGVSTDGPELAYYPPCSTGPGPKTYTFTLYALSEAPPLEPAAATGPVLTSAIAETTIASSTLNVTYTR